MANTTARGDGTSTDLFIPVKSSGGTCSAVFALLPVSSFNDCAVVHGYKKNREFWRSNTGAGVGGEQWSLLTKPVFSGFFCPADPGYPQKQEYRTHTIGTIPDLPISPVRPARGLPASGTGQQQKYRLPARRAGWSRHFPRIPCSQTMPRECCRYWSPRTRQGCR